MCVFPFVDFSESDACSDVAEFLYDLFSSSGSVAKKIESALQDAITNTIDKWVVKFNVPQSFSPYDGVTITYKVTNFTLQENSWIKADAKGTFAVLLNNGSYVNYTNYNIYDSQISPPNIWHQFVEYNETVNNTFILLNGLRVSSTVFTALTWAADVQGYLTPSYNFSVLDATLVFNLTWDRPLVGIPNDDMLTFEIGYGIVNGSCFDTDYGRYSIKNETQDDDSVVIIEFNFQHLVGNGTVTLKNYTVLVLQIEFNHI